MLTAAEKRKADPFLLIGDFNTGAHYLDEKDATFRCADQFEHLTRSAWVDVWRQFPRTCPEYTWFSRNGGFRLDHAFVSEPLLPRLAACYYSHAEREHKISDHSILFIEFKQLKPGLH